ncbi:patatin-like phospholipase family protein [Ferruginibacter sp. SUN002]|uniref:patatin-like phospholipase family protein n=1 Tax=Ferruginibacter sp. SUN002 TaxID=2937789 RepID=UPI003D35B199
MNILTLDGGGSKGVYTIGILKELELMFGVPLYEKFDFIYGTSTGSIIAAFIALGYPMTKIEAMYTDLIPKIMSKGTAKKRTRALRQELQGVLKEKEFSEFKTGIGIVATNYDSERPLIFKNDVRQAFKMKHSFKPGFGCNIVEALMASTAAYPIFQKVKIHTENQGDIVAMDGGFVGNNPILFAITDVFGSLEAKITEVKFLSLGTGNFIEKPIGFKGKCFQWLWFLRLFEKILKSNVNTTDILSKYLFPNLNLIRINDSFNQPEYGTNMVERNPNKLQSLQKLGRESFAKNEDALKKMFL